MYPYAGRWNLPRAQPMTFVRITSAYVKKICESRRRTLVRQPYNSACAAKKYAIYLSI